MKIQTYSINTAVYIVTIYVEKHDLEQKYR